MKVKPMFTEMEARALDALLAGHAKTLDGAQKRAWKKLEKAFCKYEDHMTVKAYMRESKLDFPLPERSVTKEQFDVARRNVPASYYGG